MLVMTSILLSRQDMFCPEKHVFVAKRFVLKKMILVAAPANDRLGGGVVLSVTAVGFLTVFSCVPRGVEGVKEWLFCGYC